MFKSTTLKLTSWYLLILMLVSLIFSVTIYKVAFNEVQTRLEHFQTNIQQFQNTMPPPTGIREFRINEIEQAESNLVIELVYVNFVILIIGGFGSYYLARRSLLPIEKAHEAESRFTSDASHELRTPLAVIKTEIEVALRDEKASTKDLKDVLSSNLEEIDKLSKLSEMLLNISRLDNTKLEFKQINLSKITKNIVNDFKLLPKRIQLNIHNQQFVFGNEAAISDLVKILLDNALKYSPKESLVIINLTLENKDVKFEIINSGPGIQTDKLPFIFDRFYRADSSRTNEDQKGYGLGLALARKIVELHNGELSASSEPNKLTIFTFELPIN